MGGGELEESRLAEGYTNEYPCHFATAWSSDISREIEHFQNMATPTLHTQQLKRSPQYPGFPK